MGDKGCGWEGTGDGAGEEGQEPSIFCLDVGQIRWQ